MKKIIAISVMFALIAGAVFAQANFGGSVGNGTQIIYGSNQKNAKDETDPIRTGGWKAHWGTLAATWTSEDNSAGAKLKINGDYPVHGDWGGVVVEFDDNTGEYKGASTPGNLHANGRIWWKPSEVIKIDFFKMQDEGVFGKGNYVGWGYHANSAWNNVTVLWNDKGWHSFSNGIIKGGNGFYGGTGDGFGAALTFGPFGDIFTANLWLPLEDDGETTDKLFQAHVQFLINIDGVGEIALSYAGNGANTDKDGKDTIYGGGTFFVNADLSQLLPGSMGIEVGAELPVNGSYLAGTEVKKDESKQPIRIGLGFGMNQWTSEAFQLFSRVGVVLIQEDNEWGWGHKGNIFAVDINPSIQIGDVGRVFFDVGFGYAMFDDKNANDENSALVWHFNPYLKKSIGIGDLYIGLNVWNNKITAKWYEGPVGYTEIAKDDFINFSVPVYFEVSF